MHEDTLERIDKIAGQVEACRSLLLDVIGRMEGGGIERREYAEASSKIEDAMSACRDALVAVRWNGGKRLGPKTSREREGAETARARDSLDPETHLEDAAELLAEAIGSHFCAEDELARACDRLERAMEAWDGSLEGSWASERKVYPVDIEIVYRKRIGICAESPEEAEEAARKMARGGLKPEEAWRVENVEPTLVGQEAVLDDDSPIFGAGSWT